MAVAAANSPTFQELFEQLKDPKRPIVSPKRFITRLHYQVETLAKGAHIHRNTVRKNPAAPKLQQYMNDVLRVVASATDVAGDTDKAIYWLRHYPIPDLDYKTADDLIAENKTEAVLAYLDTLRAGATG